MVPDRDSDRANFSASAYFAAKQALAGTVGHMTSRILHQNRTNQISLWWDRLAEKS